MLTLVSFSPIKEFPSRRYGVGTYPLRKPLNFIVTTVGIVGALLPSIIQHLLRLVPIGEGTILPLYEACAAVL